MIMDVLHASPETECFNESDDEAFEGYVLKDVDIVEPLTRRSHAKVAIFKCILSSQHAAKLLELHPNGRVVWMFRRYEDVVNSNLARFPRHFEELHDMLYDPVRAGWRLENVTPDDMALVRKFYDKRADDASARALIWFLRNQLLFQQNLDRDPRVLLVNYDHLVSDPDGNLEKVFKFLGIEYRPEFAGDVHNQSIRKSKPCSFDPEVKELCDGMFERLAALPHV